MNNNLKEFKTTLITVIICITVIGLTKVLVPNQSTLATVLNIAALFAMAIVISIYLYKLVIKRIKIVK